MSGFDLVHNANDAKQIWCFALPVINQVPPYKLMKARTLRSAIRVWMHKCAQSPLWNGAHRLGTKEQTRFNMLPNSFFVRVYVNPVTHFCCNKRRHISQNNCHSDFHNFPVKAAFQNPPLQFCEQVYVCVSCVSLKWLRRHVSTQVCVSDKARLSWMPVPRNH